MCFTHSNRRRLLVGFLGFCIRLLVGFLGSTVFLRSSFFLTNRGVCCLLCLYRLFEGPQVLALHVSFHQSEAFWTAIKCHPSESRPNTPKLIFSHKKASCLWRNFPSAIFSKSLRRNHFPHQDPPKRWRPVWIGLSCGFPRKDGLVKKTGDPKKENALLGFA